MVGINALSALEVGQPAAASTALVSIGSVNRINSALRRMATKFYVNTTSPIVSVNAWIQKGGTVTATNLRFRLETSVGDVPSGVVLGAETPEWSGPAASGFIGTKVFGSDSGALALNTPYWLSMYYSSGTAPDASNTIDWVSQQGWPKINDQKIRSYDGTNWTNIAISRNVPVLYFNHADGTVTGCPLTNFNTPLAAGAADLFGTFRHGIRWKVGADQIIAGAKCQLSKSGSPAALQLVCYEGATQKAVATLDAAEVVSLQDWTYILFDSPPTIAAGATGYLILRQLADGGDDANDYDLRGTTTTSAVQLSAVAPPDFFAVFGDGDDPTALSDSTLFFPHMMPLLLDPATSLVGGSPATGFTLSVVDQEDGTGATATIAGSGAAADNVVEVFEFSGAVGGLTSVGTFSRVGDGTVDLVLDEGSYFAVLTSDGYNDPGPVFFRVTGQDASYAEEIFAQVLAKVQSLPLSGIDVANIKGGKHPLPQVSFAADVTAGALVATMGEQIVRKFNSADDVGYGHLIVCWTAVNQHDNAANLTSHQKWREQIGTAFKIKPGYAPIAHPLVADITVDPASPQLFNPEAFLTHNIDAAALIVRVVLRQPR